ncbi:hypothetical protein GU335_07225 [Pseudolactococcus raffinolactis]|uniref:hypothetical protein n=1 Tax=Pseudolactococcus raffinolactis TaxID=1366 RepID=UPI001437300E|nr:hypothetical protein [Lactococcus raffinolactis]QIW56381.1 hypothetical protein GU335_07225 [Lactococcus raffinolactis]
MTIQGYQFDKIKVTPESDAALYSYLAQNSDNKVIKGATATASGLNIYVSTGKALVQGRLIEITQQHQLSAQSNTTGYVVITVDLTQSNTATGTPGTSSYIAVNNQLKMELVETLTQQDLNSGGLIYTFPLYSYTSTGTSVALTKIDKSFFKKMETATIDLGWGMSVVLTKKDGVVSANGTTTPSSNAGSTGSFNLGVKVPEVFRPINSGILMARGNNAQWANYIVNSDGSVTMATGAMNTGYTFYVSGSWVVE